MKKIYFALIFSLSLFVANAQSYDREFSLFTDSTAFQNNGTSVDFLVSMPDTGFLIINCLAKGDPFSFLQVWFPNLNIKDNPFIQTCVSSDAAVDLSIDAGYVTSGNVSFGNGSLTGGGVFDTLLYQQATLAQNLKNLLVDVSAQPCVLTIDWFRMGLPAHPIQATTTLSPKVMPGQACTLKVSNISYFYTAGNIDQIAGLVCTATTTSTNITDIAVLESPSDSSFLITFNTAAVTKSTIGFMTVNIKNLASTYTRKFDLAVNITPTAGTEEPANSELKIYPVPVQNTLTVELPDDGGYQLAVINSAGSVIMTQVVAKGVSKAELNTASLASGAYSLIIANEVGLITKKFTK